jgi:hypothetical protein
MKKRSSFTVALVVGLVGAACALLLPGGTAAAATTYPVKLSVTSSSTGAEQFMYVWDRATWQYHVVQNGSVALPAGDYFAVVRSGYYRQRNYLLVRTFSVTSAALTVTFAESGAKEAALTTDDTTAKRYTSAVWLQVPNGDVVGFGSGGPAKTYVTPFALTGVGLRIHDVLTKSGASTAVPSPYRYDLYRYYGTTIPATLVTKVATSSLGKTVTSLRGQGVTTSGTLGSGQKGGWSGSYLASPVQIPSAVTEYATPGAAFQRRLTYGSDNYLTLPDRTLAAGTAPATTVGAGPFGPRRPAAGGSTRAGNELRLDESMSVGDAAGDPGFDGRATVSAKLSSGGDVLASLNDASAYHQGLTVTVPAAAKSYQFDQTVTRKTPSSQLSTQVRNEWTFNSGTTDQASELPLLDIDLAASGLDTRNRAGTAPVEITAKAVTRNADAAEKVTALEYSTDDGAHWSDLTVTDNKATVPVPAAAAFVSLRVTATDDQGGRLRRTITRAFAGPAAAPDEAVGGTVISEVVANGGGALVFGTSGTATFTVSFLAYDPTGIADGDAYLYHGSYATPDGLLLGNGPAECVRVTDATSRCTAQFTADVRIHMANNVLAGAWHVAAWAHAANGVGYADRHLAGSVGVKKSTKVTANATPEPVTKGKTVTVTGALTRANWYNWTFAAYPAAPVALQWSKLGTTTWTTLKTVKADASGNLKTTVAATADGSYRYSFAGDSLSAPVISTADYVDVQ